jgi:hypothetical protein
MAPRVTNQSVRIVRPGSGRLFYTGITLTDLILFLIHVSISLFLLPLDTAVLIGATVFGRLPLPHNRQPHRRRDLLRDAHFYPKTILITGVGAARALGLARQFYYGGHRVVGADVGLPPIRSGGSMSNTLDAYYRMPKTHYVSNLMDIINREKIDVWIPCSDRATAVEDGVAKSTIESRTACKCIHFDSDFAMLFSQNDAFLQHVAEKGLPVVEKHDVRSRDSIHRILNRSPTKSFLIQKPGTRVRANARDAIMLPRRTPSQTYSDVSQLAVSNDHPWVLKQRAKIGKYWADLLLVQGQVKAMKIRPFREDLGWGKSRLDEGLFEAMQRLMDRFAERGGTRLTGHLSVKLVVDEEIGGHSVRYAIYIAGCRQGIAAVADLLDDPPRDFYGRYLEVLTSESDGNNVRPRGKSSSPVISIRPVAAQPPSSSIWMSHVAEVFKELRQYRRTYKTLDFCAEQLRHVPVWDRARFSRLDPVPWWWHAHVSQPLNDFILIFDVKVEAHTKRWE